MADDGNATGIPAAPRGAGAHGIAVVPGAGDRAAAPARPETAHMTEHLPSLVQDVVGHYLDALDEVAPGLVDALYLTGSVALDDFRPGRSDIDFLAVTAAPLDGDARGALRRVHARLTTLRRRPYFDGSYVTWQDLRANPAD